MCAYVWSTAGFDADLTYCNLTDRAYSKGQSVPICLRVNDGKGGSQKMPFFVEVDEFSLLEVDNSFNKAPFKGNALVQVEAGAQVSSEVRRTSAGNVVPFWTAIIDVRDGNVLSVKWDEGCNGCSGDACIDLFCGVPTTECGVQKGDTDCDLKVYVGWFGTDADGNFLTSSSKSLSNFRSYSLSDAYTAAAKTAGENQPDNPF
jgi:hypothetical protein